MEKKESRIKEITLPSSYYHINALHSLWAMYMSTDYETINGDILQEATNIFFRLYFEFDQIYQMWQTYVHGISLVHINRYYSNIEKTLSKKDENIKLIDNVIEKINIMEPSN
jgi:hypothetical protein